MKIEYKGYIAIQSDYNNHICIYKKNKLVSHISTTCKLKKEEIESFIDLFILEEWER